MIYELRVYRAVPGCLSAMIARFHNHNLRIWDRLGIRQTGFWTTIVGASNQELVYMLAWNDIAEREKRWNAFLADPEWLEVVAESEKHGQLVADIRNTLLAPTTFSAAK